jgi:hypothetical protein
VRGQYYARKMLGSRGAGSWITAPSSMREATVVCVRSEGAGSNGSEVVHVLICRSHFFFRGKNEKDEAAAPCGNLHP